jgi:DNA-binding PadR family transcriptional regulator
MRDDLGGLGRFADPARCVLLALSDGPKHGYAIMSDARTTSGAALGPGTLYATVARLETRGLIEPLALHERRRPYRLTPNGATALRDRLRGLEGVLEAGRARLERTGSEPPRSP